MKKTQKKSRQRRAKCRECGHAEVVAVAEFMRRSLPRCSQCGGVLDKAGPVESPEKHDENCRQPDRREAEAWLGYGRDQSSGAKAARTDAAADEMSTASKAAASAGMTITQPSAIHFQLRGRGWLMNIYPSNQRLYTDRNHRAPFLRMPTDRDWTLMDVVVAAIEALAENRRKGDFR